MKAKYTDEEIRQRIGRLLDNGRLTSPEWELVLRRGYVAEFREALERYADEGEAAIEEELTAIAQSATQLITDHREVFPDAMGDGSTLRRQRMAQRLHEEQLSADDEPSREVLLSHALASRMAQDPEVRSFREENGHPENYLGNYDEEGLPRNTAQWIERQWHRETLPTGMRAEDALPVLRYAAYPHRRWNPDREEYEETPAPVQSLHVAPSGTLDWLRQLAVRLAGECHWDQVVTINFILTNDAPINPSLTITVEWCERFPAQSRVVLVVDPAMAPQELCAQYQAVRRQIVGDAFPRALDKKTLWLAARTAGKTATASIADLMADWNDLMGWFAPVWRKGWTYSDKERFARDRRRAEQRVLHPNYHRPTDAHPASERE